MRHGRELAAERRKAARADESRQVTTQAWNIAAACTIREQAPGWSKEKGLDVRTQTTDSVLRGAFEAGSVHGELGHARATGLSSQVVVSDALVVEEIAKRLHSAAVRDAIQIHCDACARQGQKHPFASVMICSDATQTEAYMSKDASAIYSRSPKVAGPCTVALLVQVVTVFVPTAGLVGLAPAVETEFIVPPLIMQDETAATLSHALLQRCWLDALLPLLPHCKYFLVFLAMDSAKSNGKGSRILYQLLSQLVNETRAIVLMYWQRCDGHQCHIILKMVFQKSLLLPKMFSLAHLLRHESYRSRLLAGIRRILELHIVPVKESPPPECREFLMQWFYLTMLLNSTSRGPATATQRSSKREARNKLLAEHFELFASAFSGYLGHDGSIFIYIGSDRNLSRAAVVERCFNAVRTLFFVAVPGVPVENRWTAFYPFLSWMLSMGGLFSLGSRGFLYAFDNDREEDEHASEQDLSEEALFRLLNGKRMRSSKQLFKDILMAQLKGFTALGVGKALDRFMRLMIRDVGAMCYVDWRAKETSMGREWRHMQSPFYAGAEDQDETRDKEPTLFDLFGDNLELIRKVETSFGCILQGRRLPNDEAMPLIEFLMWSCGHAVRGGPTDKPKSHGVPYSEIVRHVRTSTLAAIGDWHIRFRMHYNSDPPQLVLLVHPSMRRKHDLRQEVVRRFAARQPCCIGRFFGAKLQPAFKRAVRDAQAGPVDMAQLVDELDVIQNWSKGRNSTTVVEKYTKSIRT